MNTLTDFLLGVGQPRVSHFPDLCTLLYTYLSTLDYWTKIVYYLFTQTSPVAHTSALTPTYIKSQKLPNWPISKELGLGRMLLPHWKLLFKINGIFWCQNLCRFMVGMLSVCYRFEFEIVGLLSVTSPALCWWSVFNRCHVGYLSVSNRAIPYRILPDMNPTGFTVSSATLSVADSWPIQWKICVFCRFRVGLAGVTGVWGVQYEQFAEN